MLTIFDLIQTKTESWVVQEIANNQSVVGDLVKYIRKQGKLREPQMKAIEAYLWLKFVGQDQKLSEIVKRGLLFDEKRLRGTEYSANFEGNYITQFLNQFAQDNELPNLQKKLLNDPHGEEYPWESILQELLHNFDYPNFLFSLPMGAGKTYLIGCFIYLDLFLPISINPISDSP